jgi:hypothetical protein
MSTTTSTSPETEGHASFLAEVRAMAVAPGLNLPIVRAVCESLHRATAEPEEASYPEARGNRVCCGSFARGAAFLHSWRRPRPRGR